MYYNDYLRMVSTCVCRAFKSRCSSQAVVKCEIVLPLLPFYHKGLTDSKCYKNATFSIHQAAEKYSVPVM